MSSFRRPKAEATLRLYSLPRRELQALCKQYGVPANKTNVAMADALSTFILAESGKSKASTGANSLGVSKSTPMKLKSERKNGLPETSLASLALNGKPKISPMKNTETILTDDKVDIRVPRSTTTPLKRGIKRSERSLQTLPEEKGKATGVPAFTRAGASLDRLGRAAPATTHDKFGKLTTAASSPKARPSTPRKRSAEAVVTRIRRSRDALPAVSFSDLLSTPKRSESRAPEVTPLNSTRRKASKMKSKLSSGISSHGDEASLVLPKAAGGSKQVSWNKRVFFADEFEAIKSGTKEPEPQPEPDTETIEVSHAEIEFKNPALHKELFGSLRSAIAGSEQVVSLVPEEGNIPPSSQKIGFEFKDMARHKELFGLCRNSEKDTEGLAFSSMDSQQAGISDCATQWRPSERSCFNTSLLSPELLHNSSTPVHDLQTLSNIREDASGGSCSSVEELEEYPERHLLQGRDLGPDLDGLNLAANRTEGRIVEPSRSHGDPLTCLYRGQSDSDPVLGLSSRSDTATVCGTGEQERDVGGSKRQAECLDGSMVNDMCGRTAAEEVNTSFTSEIKERKSHTHCSSIPDEVQRFSHEVVNKEEVEFSPTGVAMEDVVGGDADEPVFGPDCRAQIPAAQARTMQTNSTSSFTENATPLTKIQNRIDSTLAKATSILEKLASWRADAERKVREGYWEPKCTSVEEDPSAAVGLKTPTNKTLIAKMVVDRDLPSAKKRRLTPKPIVDSEKEFIVCEDLDIVSKGYAPGALKVRTPGELTSRAPDKENQVEISRKTGGLGREKKKSNKSEVLKDLSKNSSDENVHGIVKSGAGKLRPEEMSLRKLRATVKERVREIEALKDPDTRTHKVGLWVSEL